MIVDNQPGAGGIVGLQALARSPADGFSLGVVSNNVVIFPSVYKSLPFDMPGDFTPIAIVGYTPMVLVVNAKVPASNSKEFIALLKSKNGEMTYASGGNGTILHLASAMFLDEAGVQARHIPYKGVGPMITDLIGGQVDFATAALPSVQAHLKSGALRAIGVATAQRVPAAPEIPTFVEQGLPNYVVEAWFAVIGPKGLPAAEVTARSRSGGQRLRRPDGQGGDGEAGQRHQRRAGRPGHALLPQRDGQVREAGEEGGRGSAVRPFGRVLFLSRDPLLVREQLAGRELTREQAGALRDDISTDEITPLPALVHFDATLGRHAHTGFSADGELPIARDALRQAGIEVLVAGSRYGKGSSREHSPLAELSAGVRLVIAQSFERIYRQNADNLGLLTSTDLGLVERLQRGDAITLDELLADASRRPRPSCAPAGCWPMVWGLRAKRRRRYRDRRRCSRRSSNAMH